MVRDLSLSLEVQPAGSRRFCQRLDPAVERIATAVGKLVATRAKDAGVTKVVFDRGGNLYHGRVAALADAAREAGLEL